MPKDVISSTEWESWKASLRRLHEDLTGLEQADECFVEFMRSLAERQSRFAAGLFGAVFIHWLAIGVRRIFKEGNPRYPNVALQRLLKSWQAAPGILLAHGHMSPIASWTGQEWPDETGVRERAAADAAAIETKVIDIAEYANGIAHLQLVADDHSAERKMKLRPIREALAEMRKQVDCYSILLTGEPPPDLNKDRFIVEFESELERLLSPLAGLGRS